MPPYTPVLEGFAAIGDFISQLDFENYLFLTEDPLYYSAYLSSLRIAFISTEVHKGFGPLWNPQTPADVRQRTERDAHRTHAAERAVTNDGNGNGNDGMLRHAARDRIADDKPLGRLRPLKDVPVGK